MSQDNKIALTRRGGGGIVYDLSPANHDPAIKEKLIEMGWTPPVEHTPVSDSAAPKLTKEVVAAAVLLRHWSHRNGLRNESWHIANIGDVRQPPASATCPPEYATEINRLRNVIQAACSDGLDHKNGATRRSGRPRNNDD